MKFHGKLSLILKNNPTPKPQQNQPSYFKRRIPEQSMLPSIGTIKYLYDFIRMLDAPTYPLAYINYGEFKLELYNAKVVDNMLKRYCYKENK